MANDLIQKNFIVLDTFTPSLRKKFPIINDCYKVLKRYYDKNPLSLLNHQLKSRYPIALNFFQTFALNPLSLQEIAFACNTVYKTIGIELVIQVIANFAGFAIKVDEINTSDKKLTITIISENIFDLDLFEKSFIEFLNDVLIFQNLEFTFDLIVLDIPLEYAKKIYNLTEIQNIIPCKITEEYEF